MTLGDRISRWWAPAKWRDAHPEYSAGEGFADDRGVDQIVKPSFFKGKGQVSAHRSVGRYRRR